MIIYKVTHNVNNKSYIGRTVNTLEHRRSGHYREMKRSNGHFHNALRKYGKDAFVWEVIDTANTLDELNELEKYYIYLYDTYNSGYNLNLGGDGRGSFEHTDEWKKAHSERMTGESNPFYGKSHTDEMNQWYSDSQKGDKSACWGKQHTEETKQLCSEQKLGAKNPRAKTYMFTNPDGVVYTHTGLKEFCRLHGLNRNCKGLVSKKLREQGKGWKYNEI